MRPVLLVPALAALVALPAAGAAQSRAATMRDTVPPSMLPPAGKCRIWVVGVPAAQQPAPTDCATALRQKPTNGVLLYGPAQRDADADRFDPKVGQDPRNARATAERTNGSPQEQELERQRQRAERARLTQEMRERDERARREAQERAVLMGSGSARQTGGAATPSSGGTAVPRTGTANSTGAGNGTPRESKAPPESKRKPE